MKNTVKWRSPSNIALIKYWGKYAQQIPANPSISFTLNNCYTETEVSISDKKTGDIYDFDIFLDDEIKPDFKPKVAKFFKAIESQAPFLKEYHFTIKTHNSFPHSSGIASSASGLSALALCLLSLQEQLEQKKCENFLEKASEWARLGSGSAARSVYGGLVQWGAYKDIKESSNHYAIPYKGEVHKVFQDFMDYVLLVEVGSKSVSSTAGHNLMNNHPFAEQRFKQAHTNMDALLKHLASGDMEAFGALIESEALTLHAMMMSSNPYYILMKPNTLHIINSIWEFRKQTQLPLFFTLDAGANVHLLFPKHIEASVKQLIEDGLKDYLKNDKYICNQVGEGPKQLS